MHMMYSCISALANTVMLSFDLQMKHCKDLCHFKPNSPPLLLASSLLLAPAPHHLCPEGLPCSGDCVIDDLNERCWRNLNVDFLSGNMEFAL